MTGSRPPIVLASTSPRRKRLLAEAGIPFVVEPSGIVETILPQWTPPQAAVELARQKARAVFARIADKQEFYCVLAADTLVVVANEILGKPCDEEDAYRMLKLLSQQRHEVITGVCVWPCGWSQPLLEADTTYITLQPMSDEQICDYVASGHAMGKAGAFDVEQIGEQYVAKIEGSFDNVIGLPMQVVRNLLRASEERHNA